MFLRRLFAFRSFPWPQRTESGSVRGQPLRQKSEFPVTKTLRRRLKRSPQEPYLRRPQAAQKSGFVFQTYTAKSRSQFTAQRLQKAPAAPPLMTARCVILRLTARRLSPFRQRAMSIPTRSRSMLPQWRTSPSASMSKSSMR